MALFITPCPPPPPPPFATGELPRACRARTGGQWQLNVYSAISERSFIDRSLAWSVFFLPSSEHVRQRCHPVAFRQSGDFEQTKEWRKKDKILNEKRSFYALCSESSKTKPRSVKMPHLCHPHERENEQVDIKTLMQLWRKCLLPRGHSRRTIMTFLLKCRDRINVVFFAGQTCDT